jgi:hypothetical protein
MDICGKSTNVELTSNISACIHPFSSASVIQYRSSLFVDAGHGDLSMTWDLVDKKSVTFDTKHRNALLQGTLSGSANTVVSGKPNIIISCKRAFAHEVQHPILNLIKVFKSLVTYQKIEESLKRVETDAIEEKGQRTKSNLNTFSVKILVLFRLIRTAVQLKTHPAHLQ